MRQGQILAAKVTVREAVPEDASQLQALYEELTAGTCSVLGSRIAEVAEDRNSFLYVAEDQGKIVGTVHLTLCLDVMYGNQPYALLENVVVAVSRRGAGIGEALMRHAEQKCRNSNCSKIMLLSSSERADSHRFFAGLGYERDRKVGFVKYRSRLVVEEHEKSVE